jgi:hypothetical protein
VVRRRMFGNEIAIRRQNYAGSLQEIRKIQAHSNFFNFT